MAETTPEPVSIRCPRCAKRLTLPTDMLGTTEDGRVLLAVDRVPAQRHMAECANHPSRQHQHTPGTAVELHEPAQPPARQPLGAFIAPGTRACSMCGTANADCMATMRKQQPCCGACGDGNTHPAPRESMSCAEWASEHGAKA